MASEKEEEKYVYGHGSAYRLCTAQIQGLAHMDCDVI